MTAEHLEKLRIQIRNDLYSNSADLTNPNSSTPLDRDDLDRDKLMKLLSQLESPVQLAPGDGLFIPEGWWHHVTSSAHSIAINYWFRSPIYNLIHNNNISNYLLRAVYHETVSTHMTHRFHLECNKRWNLSTNATLYPSFLALMRETVQLLQISNYLLECSMSHPSCEESILTVSKSPEWINVYTRIHSRIHDNLYTCFNNISSEYVIPKNMSLLYTRFAKEVCVIIWVH